MQKVIFSMSEATAAGTAPTPMQSLLCLSVVNSIAVIPKPRSMSLHIRHGRCTGKTSRVFHRMNQSTFSAAEDFADVMKMYTNAIFVGNNTAGSSGQPLCESLESGGFFRICTRRCIAQNGEDIYNKGFAPDFRIIPSAAELAAGRDVVLEKGLEIINGSVVNGI